MPKQRTSIEQRLRAAQVAIDNALNDPDLGFALAQHGYSKSRLSEGQEMYQNALALRQRQHAERGEQHAATDTVHAAWRKAEASYMSHVKIARAALQGERGAWSSLALDGPRATTLAGWLAQARQFYGVALENAAIQNKLAAFGIAEPMLAQGRAEVEAVTAAGPQQLRERGSAQEATEAREAAMSALHAWMRDFTTIARVARHAQPQQLEKLGIAA